MVKMYRYRVIEMFKIVLFFKKNLLDDFVNCLIVVFFWWRYRDIWSIGIFRLFLWNFFRSFRVGIKIFEYVCNLNIFIFFCFYLIYVGEIIIL